jgi:XTP/dITP diphosphohydrolase
MLTELQGITNRDARFKTVIALIIGNEEKLFEGIVEGQIIQERRGTAGFGYDPIFMPKGYTQTFAEMSASLKNEISHRGRAVKLLAKWLMKH